VTFFARGALRSHTQLVLVSHGKAARRPRPTRGQLLLLPLQRFGALRFARFR
jgi:hypothetical protein